MHFVANGESTPSRRASRATVARDGHQVNPPRVGERWAYALTNVVIARH
jgi:hypothetical protein